MIVRRAVEGVSAALLGTALALGAWMHFREVDAEELREQLAYVTGAAEEESTAAPPLESADAEEDDEGARFLAANAMTYGVITRRSGLQYQVLRHGMGSTPGEGDVVYCHYRGTFIDGSEFVSTYRRGRPAQFQLSHVITGWREALEAMEVGARWRLFLPPHLAHGARGLASRRGRGPAIPPHATLVFDVELVGIQPTMTALP